MAKGREAAYSLLDLVTPAKGVRRRINGESIRFPARWARYYPRRYQAATYEFLRASCRRGSTAIDVGAHLGVFSIPMARWVGPDGQVLSFEPSPETRSVLARIARYNDLADTISVRPEAVSDRVGEAIFHVLPSSVGNANSLGIIAGAENIKVSLTTVDAAVDSEVEVSCLKIDAEGGELAVLQGARQTILRSKPAIALDVHPKAMEALGATLDELWGCLTDPGYSIRDVNGPLTRKEFVAARSLFEAYVTPG